MLKKHVSAQVRRCVVVRGVQAAVFQAPLTELLKHVHEKCHVPFELEVMILTEILDAKLSTDSLRILVLLVLYVLTL